MRQSDDITGKRGNTRFHVRMQTSCISRCRYVHRPHERSSCQVVMINPITVLAKHRPCRVTVLHDPVSMTGIEKVATTRGVSPHVKEVPYTYRSYVAETSWEKWMQRLDPILSASSLQTLIYLPPEGSLVMKLCHFFSPNRYPSSRRTESFFFSHTAPRPLTGSPRTSETDVR